MTPPSPGRRCRFLLEVAPNGGEGSLLVGVSLPAGGPFLVEELGAEELRIPLAPGSYELCTYEASAVDGLERLSARPVEGRAGERVRVEL